MNTLVVQGLERWLEPCLFSHARAAGLVFTMPVLSELGGGARLKATLVVVLGLLIAASGKFAPSADCRWWLVPGELMVGLGLGLALQLAVALIGAVVPLSVTMVTGITREARMLGAIAGSAVFLRFHGDHLLIRMLWALPPAGDPRLEAVVVPMASATRALLMALVPLGALLVAVHLVLATASRSAATGALAAAAEPVTKVIGLVVLGAMAACTWPVAWRALARILTKLGAGI